MHAEDMKGWLREAKHEKDLERIRWGVLLRLVQVTSVEGGVPK